MFSKVFNVFFVSRSKAMQNHVESMRTIYFGILNVRNVMKSRNLDMSSGCPGVQDLPSGCPGVQDLGWQEYRTGPVTVQEDMSFLQKSCFLILFFQKVCVPSSKRRQALPEKKQVF